MSEKKKFGLVIPMKTETFKLRTNSVFDDESDEDRPERKRPKIPQKKIDSKNKITSESVADPSIYEYDSIYDEMKSKQSESIAPKEKKTSRYIETLLKAADKRKKEYERRIDKKIQAEREKEGDTYKGKESFVTSSYKKKMQEMEEEEERERRESMLNDMMDISKQKDLSGFYRHFLKQTVGEEKIPVFGEKQRKEVTISEGGTSLSKSVKDSGKNVDYTNLDQDSDGIDIDDDSEDQNNEEEETSNKPSKSEMASDLSERSDDERESQKNKTKKLTSFSYKSKHFRHRKQLKTCATKSVKISSPDSESSDNGVMPFEKGFHLDKCKTLDKHNSELHIHSRHDSSSNDDELHEKSDVYKENKSVSKECTKTNLYAKRTVGDAFAAAQARYFQRMSTKNERMP